MNPSITTYVCLIVGILLLVFSVWCRLGRGPSARSWTDATVEGVVRFHLFFVPGLGLLALMFGLAPWYDELPALFGLLVFVISLVGLWLLFVWGILAVPYPRWMVPNWAQSKIAKRFKKEKWLP